jgi:hypothetical protein
VRARHVRGRGHRSPLGWVLRTWAGIRAAERLGEAMALRADPAEHARALELLDLLIAVERPSRLLPDAVGAQPRPAPTPERSAIAAS